MDKEKQLKKLWEQYFNGETYEERYAVVQAIVELNS